MKPYVLAKKRHPIKMFIWGRTGLGKTTFVASGSKHPLLKDMLFLNIEDGLVSIPDEFAEHIRVVDVTKDEKGNALNIIDTLEKILDEVLSPTPKPEWAGIRTLVIDSASDMESRSLRDIAESLVASSGGKRKDSDLFEQRDYGVNGAKLKRIFSQLRSCNLNVIFTAISKDKKSKVRNSSGQMEDVVDGIMPALTESVSSALISYMDFSWYIFQDDKGDRKLLTTAKKGIDAKTRNSQLQKEIGDIVVLKDGEDNLFKLMEIIKKYTEVQQ